MSSLKKNFVYQIIYRIVTIITPLITSPILARALGAEKIGVYSATIAFVNYFTLFAMLGVENYGTRSIAAAQDDIEKRSELFSNIYCVQVITSLIAICAYIISLYLFSSSRFLIMMIQGLWIISSLFNVNWLFFGTEQFKVTVIRNIIIKIITVACVVIFIKKPEDLAIYTLIMAGDAALSSLLVWPLLRKTIKFKKPSFSEIKRHIKPIFVLFIPILGISMFHIMDKTMLDIFSTEAQSGFYYNADKLINIPYGVITAISAVMLPRISSVYSSNKREEVKVLLRKSTELSFFLTSAIGIGIASVASVFVPFFFGPGFDECINLVYFFAPVLFIKAMSVMIRSQYLIPARRDKEYSVAVVVGLVVNLVANYIFISLFGALGAVIGTLLAEFSLMLVELLYSIKEIPFISFMIHNLYYIIAGIVMFIVVQLFLHIVSISTLAKIICSVCIGAIVYLLLCYLYWKINKNSIFHNISKKRIIRK